MENNLSFKKRKKESIKIEFIRDNINDLYAIIKINMHNPYKIYGKMHSEILHKLADSISLLEDAKLMND
jgi:hypothetical protein